MADIQSKPFFTDALTIRQLKEILANLPEANEYGEEYEVWVDDQSGNFSNCVTSVWTLNAREAGSDIILKWQ